MMMGFGFLIFLVFAGVIIVVAIAIGKLLFTNDTSLANIFNASAGKKKSREILEERYVKGEITREEFEIMKKEIE